MNTNAKPVAYLMLRLTMGFVFLMYGTTKLMKGPFVVADEMAKQFAATFLPSEVVSFFALMLPFVETLIGILLIFGLFTMFASELAGALLVALTTGLAVLGNPEGVAHNLIYSFILFGLVYYSAENRWSLDTLIHSHPSPTPAKIHYRKTA